MSSTNRSRARDSHIADYYKTPVSSILDFIMEFESDRPDLSFTTGMKFILDPCAGGRNAPGTICHQTMSYPEALMKYKDMKLSDIQTFDIREDSLADKKCDYLLQECANKYDVIITNPPFNLALSIIKKALNDVKPDGLVIMLLRLNFFGSKERFMFFRDNMPIYAYVHQRRMKFSNTTGTDSIEYMHAVWQKGNYPKFTQLRII